MVGTASITTRPNRRRAAGDDGAVLVEFALICPILFLLIFAVIEFGWAFGQNLDVRHGAREGARLAAVNYRTTTGSSGATQRDQIVAEICARLDSKAGVSVNLYRNGTAEVGQVMTVRVKKPLDQLTNFLGFALNGKTLQSIVETRIEQDATWTSMTSTSYQACP
jgi:Flp pilus assembly protein TadG